MAPKPVTPEAQAWKDKWPQLAKCLLQFGGMVTSALVIGQQIADNSSKLPSDNKGRDNVTYI